MMRDDLIESLVIGGSIAFIVLGLHALTDGAPAQVRLLALVVAGVLLFCAQLALSIRRARRRGSPPEELAQRSPMPLRLRRRRRNPFFRELTHEWTGLDEHIIDRSAAGSQPLPDQLGDLWDDPNAPDDAEPPLLPARRPSANGRRQL